MITRNVALFWTIAIVLSLVVSLTWPAVKRAMGITAPLQQTDAFPREDDGNAVIYVVDPPDRLAADMRVWIDGRLAASGEFGSRDGRTSRGWHRRLTLNLEPGDHTIRAVSNEMGAELEATFTVRDRIWATLALQPPTASSNPNPPRPSELQIFDHEPVLH